MFETLTLGKGHSSRGEKSISHSPGTRKIVFHHINEVYRLDLMNQEEILFFLFLDSSSICQMDAYKFRNNL